MSKDNIQLDGASGEALVALAANDPYWEKSRAMAPPQQGGAMNIIERLNNWCWEHETASSILVAVSYGLAGFCLGYFVGR